jgi:hypothetical protein
VRCDLEGSSRELRPIAQRKLPDIDALIARAETRRELAACSARL